MRTMIHRVIMASAMIFAIAFYSTENVQAQYQSCLPDCFNDGWGPQQNSIIMVGPCQVRVEWRQRFACGTYYDVIITGIWFLNGGCGVGPNYQTLIAAVTEQLLILNPMGFPPVSPTDPCENNWRVTLGSCWYKEVIGGVGGV